MAERRDWLKISYVVMSVIITANLIASLLLLLGVRHRNRFLLLPWIIVTSSAIVICHVWMIVSKGPVFMGDLFCVLGFIWAELCVVSHYQNLRDGVREDLTHWVHGMAASNANAAAAGQGDIFFAPMSPRSSGAPPAYEAPGVALPSNLSVDISSDADLPPPYPGGGGENAASSETQLQVRLDEGEEDDDKDKERNCSSSTAATPPPSYDACLEEEAQTNEAQEINESHD